MFERFTERARQVVVLAQEEARTLRHGYIGTEHLLLGLLREQEGLAARVLTGAGLSIDVARERVLELVGPEEQTPLGEELAGQIPFTPRAKQVLQLALREALALGHNYIGTEHVLLGLLREHRGVAVRILLEHHATSPELLREEVIRTLSGGPTAASRPLREGDDRSWLDFTPAEAFELAMRLARLASRITFEVRRHGEQEPTFLLSCRLLGNDNVLRELVALEEVGVRAVLVSPREGERHTTVRLGHLHWPPAPEVGEPGGSD